MTFGNVKYLKMAKITSVPALLLANSFWSMPAYAETEESGAQATVLEPIQFAVLLEMDFGSIAVGNEGGIVELSPSENERTCDASFTCVGEFSFSRLSLSGSDALVRVTFAPSFELIGPGESMRAEPSFDGGSGAIVRLEGGNANFDFGARLFVNANQAPGAYLGTFAVNVVYQ